ncbi:MAG: DUF2066 domain-containing protein [Alphaproteobacteria bacterium]|nr:DUF2066 domain-containing protein [Alphaproteobacteria bacterium]
MPLPPFFRRVLLLLFVVLAALPVSVRASDDGFTVSGVAVDVTAASAAEANATAMIQGQMTAARQLLERLTPESEHGSLPALDQKTVVNLVRYVTVDEEKRSAVRYIAKLTVHFNPPAVRTFIAGKKLTLIEPSAMPVLVIPVFQVSPETPPSLWEDANPWRQAWARRAGAGSLVPVELPMGDLADMSTLTAQQAAAADVAALTAMAQRQGVNDVIVVHAVVAPVVPLTLDVRIVRPSRPNEAEISRFVAEAGETLPALLDKAAESVVVWLEESWKRGDTAPKLGLASGKQLTAMAPLSSLDDWLALRRALSRTRLVKRVDVQALKRDMAQIVITSDDETALAAALGERGYALVNAGEVWTLSHAPAAPLPAHPASRQ